MYTLGVNAVYHDPSACLVHDGRVIAAAEEERFTRIKHGKRPIPFSTYELPFHAIDYCLREAGITLAEVDHVAYSYDPHLLLNGHRAGIMMPLEPSAHPTPPEWESAWDPLFLASIVNAPRHLAGGVPHHLQERFRGVRVDGPHRWHFVEHHLAHAASAFLASPFRRAAVLTIDGRGERATTSYSLGDGTRITRLGEVIMPHSLGLLYERVTEHLGFLHASDEYKVMALASYGQPTYLDGLREAIRFDEHGGYAIAPLDLTAVLGPPRRRHAEFEARHFDAARSLQAVLEETAVRLARWLRDRTGAEELCLAGGVALNCVMNARIRDEAGFSRVWAQPAAGDAGTSLGAALWIDARQREPDERSYEMTDAYLGPGFSDDDIERYLQWTKTPYQRLADVPEETAALLEQDQLLGWFQGRMEFGPRALGARSILASPIHADMQARLNELKDREEFRPVAPAVLEEEAGRWFVHGEPSPFMLFVSGVRPERADRIPAVRHVDGTARLQTIRRDQHPRYYDLLRAFHRRTGVPVLINTSFNTRSQPIVCTPADALESFWTSPLDALVLGNCLVTKRPSVG